MRHPFEAVIADMDGVLTRTALLHERSWKLVFDAYLEELDEPSRPPGVPPAIDRSPFSSDDYRSLVDGKPRYDGAADFLASRGIELPFGDPSDPPGRETICGIGNRKDEIFAELLEREGAHVFPDAVEALERWRRGGLKLAAISASRNARRVLRSAGLIERVDTVVDGRTADELGLRGKLDLIVEAGRRLGVELARCVLLEDATAGVAAGRGAGVGLVVGIDHQEGHEAGQDEHGPALLRAGAHVTVRNISELRFARRLPSALDRRAEIAARRGDRPLALFLDYDGTLTPIVEDPGAAYLSGRMRATVEALARRWPLAVVSGRDRRDVEARVGIEGVMYAGSHGFDIAGRGRRKTLPEAAEAAGQVEHATHQLERRLAGIDGVIMERKRFSVAVHYRKVRRTADVERVRQIVEEVLEPTSLRLRIGKKVLELEPAVSWHKGYAVKWLAQVMEIDFSRVLAVYVGDDETDEDAFAALAGVGIRVRVGDQVSTSLADYRLADPDEVREFLDWLAS